MILGSLLTVQSRKKHEFLNGNGVDSLSKMLHYISSIYANINLDNILKRAKGNVEIIQY